MGDKNTNKRPFSVHNLPIALSAVRPATAPGRERSGAAFLTQLLANREIAPMQPVMRSAGTQADSAYRNTDTLDVKRVPMGYRKALDA
ncbi:hypothetical protein [Pelagibacterium lentulum]|uniref:Uncharacterized protein n=1 Tax=Pelagibacterium lentulum TaxID=2029865 RepID=A0A916VU59_9HYPH|nr:hypothetical protein [Pelagibacterium lentulum]GGA35473.1 hypothetical protein GCM10011499_00990 [Pelagibacterium lentulum]